MTGELTCKHGAPLGTECDDCAPPALSSRLAKGGSFISDTYLEVVRSMPCIQCSEPPRSDPQHHPPKGRGVHRDDCTIPMCRRCHDAASGIKVVVDGKRWPAMSAAQQRRMVLHVRALIWDEATPEQWEKISADRARFYDSRLVGRSVPW